jgi:hypothetical protein
MNWIAGLLIVIMFALGVVSGLVLCEMVNAQLFGRMM